ncbi:MAG: response regulator [Burkholderiales bacterium]|nr:MAG: response regulator [Burkholderiales bacterium]
MPIHHDFSSLFELLPIGAYRSDAQGKQLRANQAMVRIFGFETEAQMLSTEKSRAAGWYVDPQRRAQFKHQLLETGTLRDFVSEMRRDNGETFWISENAHSVFNDQGELLYHEGTVEDITSHVLAQQAENAAQSLLQERTQALQITLDNAGRGIIRVSKQGRVVLYNQRFLQLLDLPQALLESKPMATELLAFQEQRGDFSGVALNSDHAMSLRRQVNQDAQGIFGEGTYLRKNRSGLMLEIATVMLADGGIVRTYSDVTAYFNAEQELAAKTQTLKLTMDHMSQGLATIDSEGRVTNSNKRYREMLGFSEELMAKQPTIDELAKLQIARGDFSDDAQSIAEEADRRMARGERLPSSGPEIWTSAAQAALGMNQIPATSSQSVTYLRKSRGRTLEVMSQALSDGTMVRTFSDVTGYVDTQEELKQKQTQLSALINTLPDWIWLKDEKGVYLLCNPAYCVHHNMRQEDMIGKTAEQLFGSEHADRFLASDRLAMTTTEPLVYQEKMVKGTQAVPGYSELIKVAMRDATGKCVGILGIGRDITERKRDELALIAAKDAALAGEKAKAEFLANMSHEIRTPMNAVIGMSDLLLETALTPPQREYAETIRTSGDALLGLINNILDFSKIESGHLELERLPVDLATCVEGALDITSSPALAKGLDLLYWIEDEVPRLVLGDVTRLRQVLINLINNAIKFTQHGEILVSLSYRKDERTNQQLLHCLVRDSGIGIPADRLDRLFHVFSQVDASTTRQYGGTGLGLAICKKLVELMGGRIWVESKQGVGSSFQFEIPCEPVPSVPSSYLGRKTSNLEGKRVLIVDDNATNCRILTLQSSRWGMQPRAAASGEQALAWLDAGEVFDVAVLDVHMPVMDGYALLSLIRQRLSAEQLPVLVLSSGGSSGDRGLGLGIAQTLMKPIKATVLHEALLQLFDRREATLASQPAALKALGPTKPPRLADEIPLRILLAEDNLVNQRVATLILNGLGYEIKLAVNGQEALDAVLRSIGEGQTIDVILMDVQMPVLDGLAATRELCSQYPSPVRPWIVAMTANALEGDREICLAAGMDDYISKPVRAQALVEGLRRAAGGLAERKS